MKAPVACPICDAPPSRREEMTGGRELCNCCGFMLRFDERHELVEYATTSKHPPGLEEMLGAVLVALVLAIGGAGCASTGTTAAPAPASPPRMTFDEALPGELELCVPKSAYVRFEYPVACLSLRDLRAQLRARQLVQAPTLPAPESE